MLIKCYIKSEVFRNYLAYHFAQSDGAFQVFRSSQLGRYIISRIRYSEKKVEFKEDENTVTFKLPNSSALPSIQTKFCYFTSEDMRLIEDYIDCIFYVDFKEYYLWSRQHGLQQKQAIQNFLITRKIVSRIGDYDTLKKFEYRQEKKRLAELTKKFINQVNYQDRIIRESATKFHNTLSQNTKLR
jgi:hypothetical protein